MAQFTSEQQKEVVTQLTRIADSLEVIAKNSEPRVTHVQAKTSFTQEEMQKMRKEAIENKI